MQQGTMVPMTDTLDLITGAEASRILGVDPATVSRWSSENLRPEARKLTHVTKVGNYKMFKRKDVIALRDQLAKEAT